MPDSASNPDNPWLSGPDPQPSSSPNPLPSTNPSGEIPSYTPNSSPNQPSGYLNGQEDPSPVPSARSPLSQPPESSPHANELETPKSPYLVDQPPPQSPYPPHSSSQPGRPLRKIFIGALVALLFLLATGSGFAYYKLYYLDTLSAPRDLYLNTLNVKSGSFKVNASVTPGDNSTLGTLGQITTFASGSFDNTNKKNPKFDITLNGTVANSSFSGQIIEADSIIYLKVTKFDVLQALGIKLPNDWYKATLPAAKEVKNCDYSSLKNPGNTFDQLTGRLVPLKNTSRVGLFETIDGHQTTHFYGQIDNSKLGPYVKELNTQLPADCQITLNPDEYKDLTITYDVWIGSDFDRINLSINNSKDNSKFYLSTDISDFNKPVNVTPPKNAQDLQKALSNLAPSLPSPKSPNKTSPPIF